LPSRLKLGVEKHPDGYVAYPLGLGRGAILGQGDCYEAALGVEAGIECSRSGEGAHAWIFFTAPVAASLARRLGTLITAKGSCFYPGIKLSTYDRFFPNQDTLPEGGFGNLIALPLQRRTRAHGNSVFLDQPLSPMPDQWRYLAEVRKVSPDELRRLLNRVGPLMEEGSCDHPPNSISLRYDEKALDLIPDSVPNGIFNGVVKARRTAHIEVRTESLPACLIASLRRCSLLTATSSSMNATMCPPPLLKPLSRSALPDLFSG
jgi:hypothetical protein